MLILQVLKSLFLLLFLCTILNITISIAIWQSAVAIACCLTTNCGWLSVCKCSFDGISYLATTIGIQRQFVSSFGLSSIKVGFPAGFGPCAWKSIFILLKIGLRKISVQLILDWHKCELPKKNTQTYLK